MLLGEKNKYGTIWYHASRGELERVQRIVDRIKNSCGQNEGVSSGNGDCIDSDSNITSNRDGDNDRDDERYGGNNGKIKNNGDKNDIKSDSNNSIITGSAKQPMEKVSKVKHTELTENGKSSSVPIIASTDDSDGTDRSTAGLDTAHTEFQLLNQRQSLKLKLKQKILFSVNSRDRDYLRTALHYACKYDRYAVVRYLI